MGFSGTHSPCSWKCSGVCIPGYIKIEQIWSEQLFLRKLTILYRTFSSLSSLGQYCVPGSLLSTLLILIHLIHIIEVWSKYISCFSWAFISSYWAPGSVQSAVHTVDCLIVMATFVYKYGNGALWSYIIWLHLCLTLYRMWSTVSYCVGSCLLVELSRKV